MSVEGIIVDKERTSKTIEMSLQARENRTLIFSEDIIPPEEHFVQIIREYSKEINDERFPLNALFLTTTMVFGSDTRSFFRGISDLDQVRRYAWIFMPERVVGVERSEVFGACEDFLKPAGYSQNALEQWIHNCRVLAEQYGGDVRNFFKRNDNNAQRIIDSLVVYPRAKTKYKKEFRRFGPKLSRLFVQWVSQYQLYDLEGTEEVGLPVDFQIARIIIQTGGLRLDEPTQAHYLTQKVLLPLLISLCSENKWSTQEVSETLWLVGSHCCNKRKHEQCPVNDMCGRLISRQPYDKGGLFDPKDFGRYEIV